MILCNIVFDLVLKISFSKILTCYVGNLQVTNVKRVAYTVYIATVKLISGILFISGFESTVTTATAAATTSSLDCLNLIVQSITNSQKLLDTQQPEPT